MRRMGRRCGRQQAGRDFEVEVLETRTLLSAAAWPNETLLAVPRFADLWHLNNTGQTLTVHPQGSATGTAGADIHAGAAWNLTTGSREVVVAVFDTGVDITHPDLAANIWTNPGLATPFGGADVHGWNFVDNNADVSDLVGHGTLVAGIIGAVGNNALGIAGVNWQVSILPVKVGTAAGVSSSALAAGVNYVIGLKRQGVRVVAINASFASFAAPTANEIAAIRAAGDEGILWVNAAGNSGTDLDLAGLPAAPGWAGLTNLLTVAATDNQDQLWARSNDGMRSVQLAAPGVDILSTAAGGTYAVASGTSFAAPLVAGAAALMAAEVPTATLGQIRAALLGSADPLAALSGKVQTGGRLDVYGALQKLLGDVPPVGWLDVASPTQVAGWAFDQNAGAAALGVQVVIDGQVAATLTADGARPDLAGWLGSANHGFHVALGALTPGYHRVEVWTFDVPTGTPVLLGSRTVSTFAVPVGWVDSLTSKQVVGWAFCADAADGGAGAVAVRIDVDGVARWVTADQARPDLVAGFGSANHGFAYTLPALGAGKHTVTVWALNPANQALMQLKTATLTVTETSRDRLPVGAVDAASPTVISGWAFDREAGSKPVMVQVAIDGAVIGTTLANQARPDLKRALGSANHGFGFVPGPLSAGVHRVDVFGINPQTNVPVLIKSVLMNYAPVGGWVDVFGPDQIAGWAYWGADKTQAVAVRVDVDGSFGALVTADAWRPDLTSFLGTPGHGFGVPGLQLAPGAHTVTVAVIDPYTRAAVALRTGLLTI